MNTSTPTYRFAIWTGISLILLLLLAVIGTFGQIVPIVHAQQATPIPDPTVTALEKKKLEQEVRKLELENSPSLLRWLASNFSILALIGGGLFGLVKWLNEQRDRERDRLDQQSRLERDRLDQQSRLERDRLDQQSKQLQDQREERGKRTEERFLRTIEGLGSGSLPMQVISAVTLRTFLHPDYTQYYAQIFDLAVTQLRLIRKDPSPEPPNALEQALITLFKESIPFVREQMKAEHKSHLLLLDAARVPLYSADLAGIDLSFVWMPGAELRWAELSVRRDIDKKWVTSSFSSANLERADLSYANLEYVQFAYSKLRGAKLVGANLKGADFLSADISGTELNDSILEDADLRKADLSKANPEAARTLKRAHMYLATGLSFQQMEACKAKGAIFTEDKPPTPNILEQFGIT